MPIRYYKLNMRTDHCLATLILICLLTYQILLSSVEAMSIMSDASTPPTGFTRSLISYAL